MLEGKLYHEDRKILRSHAIEDLPDTLPHAEEVKLGSCKLHMGPDQEAKVSVYVTAFPAKFWRFEITDIEGRQHNMKTGSGFLANYWDFVEQVAGAMISMKQIGDEPGDESMTLIHDEYLVNGCPSCGSLLEWDGHVWKCPQECDMIPNTNAPEEVKPTIHLTERDGNAMMILGKCERIMKKAGWSEERRQEFRDEAMSGDYDHLLQTVMKNFNVQ